MTLIARIQALILARVKLAAFLVTMLVVGGFALPAATAEAPCSDCDLVLAERDLPDGYAYDADSPERDPKGQARSIQIDNCVVATKLRREPPGTEGQFALFVTTHDPIAADENVIRFKTAKRARFFAAAFDDYVRDGPKCDVVKARRRDGSVFELERLEPMNLGEIGDQRTAMVSNSAIDGGPDQFLAIVRTGRIVLVVEAFESEAIDEVRFVQLVDDAVTAATD